MDAKLAEDVMDYLMRTENITHMGDGRGGIGRLTGSDKTAMRLLGFRV